MLLVIGRLACGVRARGSLGLRLLPEEIEPELCCQIPSDQLGDPREFQFMYFETPVVVGGLARTLGGSQRRPVLMRALLRLSFSRAGPAHSLQFVFVFRQTRYLCVL